MPYEFNLVFNIRFIRMSNIVDANRLVGGMCYSTLDGEYLGEYYSTRKGPGGQEYTFELKSLSGPGLRFKKTNCYENSSGENRKRKSRRVRKERKIKRKRKSRRSP